MAIGAGTVDVVRSGPRHHYAERGECHRQWYPKGGTPSVGDETDGFVGLGNKKYIYTFGVINTT